MLKSYLIIERSALPDYFLKVVEARRLIESGSCAQVSDAVRKVGISRSTYYKYKDKIIEPSELNFGHKVSLMLTLTHEAGNLSRVLNTVSGCGANILTITQSLPLHGTAGIMLTLDTIKMSAPVEQLIEDLKMLNGVERVRLLAVE
jgi:chorismate mutase